jgi:hypothetical protein
VMQGDEGRTGGPEENGAEAGGGQTEAHHAAGTLIDRGWLIDRGSLIDRGWLIDQLTLNISPQMVCQLASMDYGASEISIWCECQISLYLYLGVFGLTHGTYCKWKAQREKWINLTILSAFPS